MYRLTQNLSTQFFLNSPVMSSNDPPIVDPPDSESHQPNSSSPTSDVFNQTSPSQIEIDLTISNSTTRSSRHDLPLPVFAIVLGIISLVAIITSVTWVSGIMQDQLEPTPNTQTTSWKN